MSKVEKTQIKLAFDAEPFLEFRKILFKNGVSAQDFFTNMIAFVNNKDEFAEYLLEQVKGSKKERINAGNKESDISEDLLYELFEEKLK